MRTVFVYRPPENRKEYLDEREHDRLMEKESKRKCKMIHRPGYATLMNMKYYKEEGGEQ